MNPFDRVDDYEFALSLARRQFPSVDCQSASRASSGWNEAVIEIRDTYNNLLCSFESSEYLLYRARIVRPRIESGPRSDSVSTATTRNHSPLLPAAAKSARSMVGLIKGISYLFSGIILFLGFLLAIQASSQGNGAAALIVFLLFGLAAFASHWFVKLAYIGLEMMADISEDLRLIRLSTSPRE